MCVYLILGAPTMSCPDCSTHHLIWRLASAQQTFVDGVTELGRTRCIEHFCLSFGGTTILEVGKHVCVPWVVHFSPLEETRKDIVPGGGIGESGRGTLRWTVALLCDPDQGLLL